MTYCDAHIHLAQCSVGDLTAFKVNNDYFALACALNHGEFERLCKIAGSTARKILVSYGLHPQDPLFQSIEFLKENNRMFTEECAYLEGLLKQKKIDAVGEAGFDFFTPELRAGAEAQREAWRACLDLALKYAIPLVVHNRKALDEMLCYSRALSCIPAVIFHSFAFTVREAETILKRGINAYFSFGKPLLTGSRRQAECVKKLPLGRILLETDAPFQTLKNQSESLPSEIAGVYAAAAEIRGIALEELCAALGRNFNTLKKR